MSPWTPRRLCHRCGRASRELVRGLCRERCAPRAEQARTRFEPGRRWYQTPRWRALRRAQLEAHPLCQCESCDEGRGRVTAANTVDHIRPHGGDPALFWAPDNLQSLSEACHGAKTAREVAGRLAALEG